MLIEDCNLLEYGAVLFGTTEPTIWGEPSASIFNIE
jgi:hypothetical protein